MSRIIKNIINSVLGYEENVYGLFLDNNRGDLDIINLNAKLFSFNTYTADTNNKIQIIRDIDISNNLYLTPNAFINNTFIHYHSAKNLAAQFRVPLINVFKQYENIKQEVIFEIANKLLITDINLVTNKELADQYYIYNYRIINDNLDTIIKEEINKWKQI